MEILLFIAGFQGIIILILIKIISKQFCKIDYLIKENQEALLLVKLAQEGPPINKDIIFDNEGGYKIVDKIC